MLLWGGADDVFSPVAHSEWLADRIPEVLTWTPPSSGHFDAFRVLPDVLSWLIT